MDPGDGLVLTEPVTGTLRLSRTNRGLRGEGPPHDGDRRRVRALPATAVTPVEARIDEEVLPSIDLTSGFAVVLEEGDDPETTRLTDHHELDLRPLVIEAINLVEPIAPLCEPDCPGLCPDCGERLEPGHVHDDTSIDPRLEALRAFRVDGSGDSG